MNIYLMDEYKVTKLRIFKLHGYSVHQWISNTLFSN